MHSAGLAERQAAERRHTKIECPPPENQMHSYRESILSGMLIKLFERILLIFRIVEQPLLKIFALA